MSVSGWTDWHGREKPQFPPYVDWANQIGGELASTRDEAFGLVNDDPDKLVHAHNIDSVVRTLFDFTLPALNNHPRREDVKKIIDEVVDDLQAVEEATPKVPNFADNENFDPENWLPAIPGDLDLPRKSVIVGVIDRGIAIGHRCTRMANGQSRILSAWQQISNRGTASHPMPGSKKLPFGVELLTPEINSRLAASSSNGKLDGDLDEDVFNRAVGLEDYANIHGHRELGRQIAHGTHILNTAAGIGEPADEPEKADRLRIMTVNLPDRSIVGLSGRHLEYFVLFGLLRMVATADRIWSAKHSSGHEKKDLAGYPLIINLSFAKQAGAKDGDDIISRFIKKLNRVRAIFNWQPVYIVMPTGNDNLQRGNAWTYLEPRKEQALEWRIQPEDQSSNYVEVWANAQLERNGSVCNDSLAIQVITPEGRSSPFVLGQPSQYMGITGVVRVYCEQKIHKQSNGKETAMVQYVICAAPTLLHEANPPVAPAGEWLIKVQNRGAANLLVTFNVQTDLSEQPESKTSMLSYFDNEHYQRHHHDTGRLLDSYNYPEKYNCKPPWKRKRIDYDNFIDGDGGRPNPGPVKRHGSLNALARFASEKTGPEGNYKPGAIVVGGYRLTDGRPADYSSTGVGKRPDLKTDRLKKFLAAPIAAFPVDDGYAHTGRLGAGARDGSIVAMQGTSFAASQMTAYAARLLLKDGWNKKFRLKSKIFADAENAEWVKCKYEGYSDIEKTGSGRLPPEAATIIRVLRD